MYNATRPSETCVYSSRFVQLPIDLHNGIASLTDNCPPLHKPIRHADHAQRSAQLSLDDECSALNPMTQRAPINVFAQYKP
jgi:hypothetical protein